MTEIRLRARLLRGLRAAILASRRTPHTGQIACRRRALRRYFLNVTRRTAATSNSHDSHALRSNVPTLHNPPPRRPLGIYAFNAPNLYVPQTRYFRYPDLNDLKNFTCKHCGARLWWEERSFNCCNFGAVAIPRLRPVSDNIWRLFNTEAFRTYQR